MKFKATQRAWRDAKMHASAELQTSPGAGSPQGRRRASRRLAAFTLAEVLAALVFMAILIPVAMEGLRIANLAGQVGQRKAAAARVAERVLNEMLVTGQSANSARGGSVFEGENEYRYSVRTQPRVQDAMRMLTVEVTFPVQGRNYDVQLSTLVDPSAP